MRINKIDGLPVKDAKKSIRILVTKKDIKKGKRKTVAGCPVANACCDNAKVLEARVHISRVYLRIDDKCWLRYIVPKNLRDNIAKFDNGSQFTSGTFTLTKAWPSEVIGSKRKSGPRLKVGKKPRAYAALVGARPSPQQDTSKD